jgi:hypothetical protein
MSAYIKIGNVIAIEKKNTLMNVMWFNDLDTLSNAIVEW